MGRLHKISLPKNRANSRMPSEVELEGELNHARVVYRPTNYSETAECVYILHSAATAGQVELRVVKGVEKLGTEVQPHTLVWQREVLDE